MDDSAVFVFRGIFGGYEMPSDYNWAKPKAIIVQPISAAFLTFQFPKYV